MNWINHFLVSFNLIYFLFYEKVSIFMLIAFCIAFGLFLDFDFLTRRYLFKTKGKDLRTFIQEPFGFIFIAIPLGIILSYFNSIYFWLTTLPFAAHIVLDYVTIHKVFPFSPFSNKKVKTGFIYPVKTLDVKKMPSFKLFNENYITLINLIILILILI